MFCGSLSQQAIRSCVGQATSSAAAAAAAGHAHVLVLACCATAAVGDFTEVAVQHGFAAGSLRCWEYDVSNRGDSAAGRLLAVVGALPTTAQHLVDAAVESVRMFRTGWGSNTASNVLQCAGLPGSGSQPAGDQRLVCGSQLLLVVLHAGTSLRLLLPCATAVAAALPTKVQWMEEASRVLVGSAAFSSGHMQQVMQPSLLSASGMQLLACPSEALSLVAEVARDKGYSVGAVRCWDTCADPRLDTEDGRHVRMLPAVGVANAAGEIPSAVLQFRTQKFGLLGVIKVEQDYVLPQQQQAAVPAEQKTVDMMDLTADSDDGDDNFPIRVRGSKAQLPAGVGLPAVPTPVVGMAALLDAVGLNPAAEVGIGCIEGQLQVCQLCGCRTCHSLLHTV